MNKTEQETPFSEETIKFRPHIVYKFFGPFNRPRRVFKGWHLFPFHPVCIYTRKQIKISDTAVNRTGAAGL